VPFLHRRSHVTALFNLKYTASLLLHEETLILPTERIFVFRTILTTSSDIFLNSINRLVFAVAMQVHLDEFQVLEG
jgi:hypothetical protein